MGCFNGKTWVGSGNLLTSYNPSTGRAVATVREATPEEYEECIANMEAGKKAWAEVS